MDIASLIKVVIYFHHTEDIEIDNWAGRLLSTEKCLIKNRLNNISAMYPEITCVELSISNKKCFLMFPYRTPIKISNNKNFWERNKYIG